MTMAGSSNPRLPLVVFVNSKSGGQQGPQVMTKVRKHFPDAHIHDLAEGAPDAILQQRINTRYIILACGGDGTVNWVLNSIDKLGLRDNMRPPVAILPLGTGNDLSRTLRWGGSYAKNRVRALTSELSKACIVKMDRWMVQITNTEAFHNNNSNNNAGSSSSPTASARKRPKARTNSSIALTNAPYIEHKMSNYFSIGMDANIALDFHSFREQHPEKCTNRVRNLGHYAMFGMQRSLNSESLKAHIELEVDGVNIKVSKKIRAVVVLNTPFYSGGGTPWGKVSKNSKNGFVQSAVDDGMVEVVGFSGAVQAAVAHSNLAPGIRLAQGRHVKITTKKSIAAQVDGEPWIQPTCVINIVYQGTANLLANSPSSIPLEEDPENQVENVVEPEIISRAALYRSQTVDEGPRGPVARAGPSSSHIRTQQSSQPINARSASSMQIRPAATLAAKVGRHASEAALQQQKAQQQQNESSPAEAKVITQPGPVQVEKRRKGRFYCDGCGLEFFLAYMLEHHMNTNCSKIPPLITSQQQQNETIVLNISTTIATATISTATTPTSTPTTPNNKTVEKIQVQPLPAIPEVPTEQQRQQQQQQPQPPSPTFYNINNNSSGARSSRSNSNNSNNSRRSSSVDDEHNKLQIEEVVVDEASLHREALRRESSRDIKAHGPQRDGADIIVS